MTKMTKIRIAMALGCLLAIGASATLAYFIRSASSEATDSSSTGVLMMVAVAALVLAAASAGRRRRKQGNRNQEANKAVDAEHEPR
jgi:MYXO-CTERM domain-containing protein